MADENKPSDKVVRLVWGPTDDTPVRYSNQMSVSFAGSTEFHITFGHLSPPLAGLDENEIPDVLSIKPIITIVTSPDVMRAFVQALKGNLDNFEKMIAETEKK